MGEGGEGRGAKLHEGEKALSSINHSILSGGGEDLDREGVGIISGARWFGRRGGGGVGWITIEYYNIVNLTFTQII
jgi:hypothetical protein